MLIRAVRSRAVQPKSLHEYKINLAARDGETIAVSIPAGTVRVCWVCDSLEMVYTIDRVVLSGNSQFVREPIYSGGEPLPNPAYELMIHSGTSGHLAFQSIDPIVPEIEIVSIKLEVRN